MKHNITLTIDGKMHKLMKGCELCNKCSLHGFCSNTLLNLCPAIALGGAYFVELKVEK